jgi:DNA-directed RNA polymerase
MSSLRGALGLARSASRSARASAAPAQRLAAAALAVTAATGSATPVRTAAFSTLAFPLPAAARAPAAPAAAALLSLAPPARAFSTPGLHIVTPISRTVGGTDGTPSKVPPTWASGGDGVAHSAEELVASQSPEVLETLVSDHARSPEDDAADVAAIDQRLDAEIAEYVDELEEVAFPPPRPETPRYASVRTPMAMDAELLEQAGAYEVDASVRATMRIHLLLHLARSSEPGPNGEPPKYRSVRVDERSLDREISLALRLFTSAQSNVDFSSPTYLSMAVEAVIAHIDAIIAGARQQAERVMSQLAYDDELLVSIYSKEQIARQYSAYVRETGNRVSPALFERQLLLETRAVSASVQRYREMSTELAAMGRGATLRPAQQFVLGWFEPLCRAVEREQTLIAQKVPGEQRRIYGPYLQALGAPELACIVMHELLNRLLISPNGVRFIEVAVAVGRAVNAEVNLNYIRGDKTAWRVLNKVVPVQQQTTTTLLGRARRFMPEGSMWSEVVRAQVGACLLKIMLNTVTTAMSPTETHLRRLGDVEFTSTVPMTADAVSRNRSQDRVEREVAERALRDVPADATEEEIQAAAAAAAAQALAEEERRQNLSPADDAYNANIPLSERAFHHEFLQTGGSHIIGVIRCHKDILALIEEGHAFVAALAPKLMPMVIPPRVWNQAGAGGYLTSPSSVLRAKGSHQQLRAVRNATMPAVYESLNALGRVPWRVNDRVLDVVLKLWERGGAVTDLPSRLDIAPLKEPARPDLSALDPEDPVTRGLAIDYEKAQREHKRSTDLVGQRNADLHSLRCDVTLKLDQAQELRGQDIYFPCNLDFRGRAYPIPPHLNHLGSDMARGILRFAEARPLGARGLYWLYAHLAAQFGVDKISFDDRVAYAKSHLARILEAADDPLKPVVPNPRYGRPRDPLEPPVVEPELMPWWQAADSPWQALATCFEIANAVRSPDPSKYECALPVHQDGSCNGLQHYAALGRDELGGSRVNLMPADKPQDVYSHVLAQVKVLMEEDRQAGNVIAELLLPHLTRKVVKQTVMTSVYGVTFVGAREQVMRQLVDLRAVQWPEPKEKSIYAASMYVARLTLSSLSAVFTGAKSIMTWLGECAALMTKEQQPVSWVTPLGLPVTQPYRKSTAFTVRTLMQSVTFNDNNDALPVSTTRQRAAFPPNFVHSLDATHMMTTAIECERRGLVFSSVHDSFWTHACDIDSMNEVLREQFIALYSQPILDDLYTSFCVRFPHVNFPPVPRAGTLDISRIRESKYFFS